MSKGPSSTPVIPTPPPAPKGGRRKKASVLGRGGIWFLLMVVGFGAGFGVYELVPDFRPYVDYWVALALS